jgi:16S rRNA processing protein RimM
MELFVIGTIVKTSGLKGRLKVVSYLESTDTLLSLEEAYLRQENDERGPFKLKNIQARGNNFLVELEGIDDIANARSFLGWHFLIPVDKLKKLPEDEYYWRDIEGLKVITEEGNDLGRIETIFRTGSNDVYVVTGGEREILLPNIADVIRKIDIDQGVMVVSLLKGL